MYIDEIPSVITSKNMSNNDDANRLNQIRRRWKDLNYEVCNMCMFYALADHKDKICYKCEEDQEFNRPERKRPYCGHHDVYSKSGEDIHFLLKIIDEMKQSHCDVVQNLKGRY